MFLQTSFSPENPPEKARLAVSAGNHAIVYSPDIVSEPMTLITESPLDPPDPEWKTGPDRDSGYGRIAKNVLENMPPVRNYTTLLSCAK